MGAIREVGRKLPKTSSDSQGKKTAQKDKHNRVKYPLIFERSNKT